MTNRFVDHGLRTPLQFLRGVGPDRAKLLERLELRTAQDLLFFFPRDYVDLSKPCPVAELQNGVAASIVGCVEDFESRTTKHGRTIFGVLLRQDQEFFRAVWFNQPFMERRFRRGQRVLVSGNATLQGGRWQFVHPRVTPLADDEAAPGEILPVYPLTEGLKQHQLRKITQHAIADFVHFVPEAFPADYLQQRQLCSLQTALREVHCPTCAAQLSAARYRLVYQELFVMQLGLALRQRQLVDRCRATELAVDARVDARIRRLFPFDLTVDQQRAIQDIAADMGRPVPMNRLLQGDVGTGKTAVAAYAMLLAVARGSQAVLMAPTEVLARQHFATLSQLLGKSQVNVAFLSGATSAKERHDLTERLRRGEINLLVGTQAVIGRELPFHRLGLLVIDEQHKFGVIQRAALRQGDTDPHYLVMTATPIPRTIAMTLFGDLDVSVLRASPPGRQVIRTYLADETQRASWWEFFRRKLREGQQGFVIAPVVDEDEDQEIVSATSALEHLANGELSDFRLDLLHGRLRVEDKMNAMSEFASGKTQVLVATSVVEVGIDVPNANLMTIEHGDRFGLSQLHQLRGRVGRGRFPGYVCVFADGASPESIQRLEAFARTQDGFELAEVDFQLRGPGELFGTRQHGLPPLMVADLRRDLDVLEHARRDARELVTQSPNLADPAWASIRKQVFHRYGDSLELSDVG